MPSRYGDCIYGGFLFLNYIFAIFNILLFVNCILLCISVIFSEKKTCFYLVGGKQRKQGKMFSFL